MGAASGFTCAAEVGQKRAGIWAVVLLDPHLVSFCRASRETSAGPCRNSQGWACNCCDAFFQRQHPLLPRHAVGYSGLRLRLRIYAAFTVDLKSCCVGWDADQARACLGIDRRAMHVSH